MRLTCAVSLSRSVSKSREAHTPLSAPTLLQDQTDTPEWGPQETVAFRRERLLPPLPVADVQVYLQWEGEAPRLPQKIAAANVSQGGCCLLAALLARCRLQACAAGTACCVAAALPRPAKRARCGTQGRGA